MFGQQIEAEVIGYDEERWEIILSKKKADAHPRTQFAAGKVFLAAVTARHNTWIEVHLEGGVYGRLAHAEMPCEERLSVSTRLQAGDSIEVEIIGHDAESGQPLVSLNRQIQAQQIELEALVTALVGGKPVHFGQRQSSGSQDEDRRETASADLRLSILLADDNEQILQTTRSYLEHPKRGHTTMIARTIDETLEMIRGVERLDVALVDLQFGPRLITGNGIFELIRKRFPRARILLYTGNIGVLSDDERTELQEYVSGVIHKLFPIDLVHRIVIGDDEAPSIQEDISSAEEGPESETPQLSNASIHHGITRRLGSLAKAWEGSSVVILGYEHESDTTSVIAHRTCDGWRPGGIELIHHGDLAGLLVDQEPVEFDYGPYLDNKLRRLMISLGAEFLQGCPIRINGYRGHLACLHLGACHPSPVEGISITNAIKRIQLEIERDLLGARIQLFQQGTSAGALMLGITHEFKQMLAPIMTRASLLCDILDPSGKGDNLAAWREATLLEEEIDLLSDIIYGFLKVSQAKPTDKRSLREIVLKTIELCRLAAQKYHVCIVDYGLDGLPETPVTATLQQALMNLVINALQHLSLTPGPGERDLRCKVVKISHDIGRNGETILQVMDNGYGIATNRKDLLFRMFETTRDAGFGLGLHLSRQIVERMGGRIRHCPCVRYSRNTFEIILPGTFSR